MTGFNNGLKPAILMCKGNIYYGNFSKLARNSG